jgi:hypothetical protein
MNGFAFLHAFIEDVFSRLKLPIELGHLRADYFVWHLRPPDCLVVPRGIKCSIALQSAL